WLPRNVSPALPSSLVTRMPAPLLFEIRLHGPVVQAVASAIVASDAVLEYPTVLLMVKPANTMPLPPLGSAVERSAANPMVLPWISAPLVILGIDDSPNSAMPSDALPEMRLFATVESLAAISATPVPLASAFVPVANNLISGNASDGIALFGE